MRVVRLTKQSNGNVLYLVASAITAVTISDSKTAVYIVGDSIPFEVKEEAQTVLERMGAE